MHADQEILSKRVLGLEEFNFNVACKRMERLVDTTISHLTQNMTNYNFEKLYIFSLGDLINGDIHSGKDHSEWGNAIKNALGVGEIMQEGP
jgi:hypothetical protein